MTVGDESSGTQGGCVHASPDAGPRYGGFDSSHGQDVGALALAVPTDRLSEAVPAELQLLSTSAWGILANVRLAGWEAAGPTSNRMDLL